FRVGRVDARLAGAARRAALCADEQIDRDVLRNLPVLLGLLRVPAEAGARQQVRRIFCVPGDSHDASLVRCVAVREAPPHVEAIPADSRPRQWIMWGILRYADATATPQRGAFTPRGGA